MDRFELRNPDSAESELDLFIREQRLKGTPEKQIVDSFLVSIEQVVKTAESSGYESGSEYSGSAYEDGKVAAESECEGEISDLKGQISDLKEKVSELEKDD